MRNSKALLCNSAAREHLSYKIVGWQLQPVLGSKQTNKQKVPGKDVLL